MAMVAVAAVVAVRGLTVIDSDAPQPCDATARASTSRRELPAISAGG